LAVVGKKLVIELVRKAQAEKDSRKRAELWEEIRGLGLPHDAIVVEGDVIGKDNKEENHGTRR